MDDVETVRMPPTFESPVPSKDVNIELPSENCVVVRFGNVEVAVVLVAVKYGPTRTPLDEMLVTASDPAVMVPVTVRSPFTVVVPRVVLPAENVVAEALPKVEVFDVKVERVAVPLLMVTFVSVAPSLDTPLFDPPVFELPPPERLTLFKPCDTLSCTNGRTTAITASSKALPMNPVG